jgi:hypothetical protein
MPLPENILMHGQGRIVGHTKGEELLDLAIAFYLDDIDYVNWAALQDAKRLDTPLDFYFSDGNAFHHETLMKVRQYLVNQRERQLDYENEARDGGHMGAAAIFSEKKNLLGDLVGLLDNWLTPTAAEPGGEPGDPTVGG